MFLASYETAHFSFQAFGETEARARRALRLGWEEHVRQTGADPDYFVADDVGLLEFQPDQCFRDGFLIVSQGIPCKDAEEGAAQIERARAAAYDACYACVVERAGQRASIRDRHTCGKDKGKKP